MNLPRITARVRADGRSRRAIRPVERLESRDLLTLVVNNIGPIVAGVTPIVNAPIATFLASDIGGKDTDTFSAMISWGDGTATTPATVTLGPGGGFTVVGSHQYLTASPKDMADTITVTVTDETNSPPTPASASNTVIVQSAPVTLTGSAITVKTNGTFTGPVASFTDANPSAQYSDFAASIDWGDGTVTGFGTSTPASVTISANPTGGFLVQGTHAYMLPFKAETTKITVYDLVNSQAVNQTVAYGTAALAAVPAFTAIPQFLVLPAASTPPTPLVAGSFLYTMPANETTPSVFTATINWGDGHIITGKVVPATAQSSTTIYNVEGMNTYVAAGQYNVTVTVADQYGNSIPINSVATVTSPLISATGTDISITPGTAFTGPVAFFTDALPLARTVPPVAAIDWGNGTTSVGTVTGPNASGLFTVSGTINYGSGNLLPSYTVKVSIAGPSGETGMATSTAYVHQSVFNPIGQVVTASPGTALSTIFGAFTYVPPAGTPPQKFLATINFGDNQTSPGQVVLVDGVYDVTGTHTYAASGSYPVTITVADQIGNTGTITSSASVTGSSLNATGVKIAITRQSPFNGVVASFTDANPLAKLIAPTATIDWGDGNLTVGTVAGPNANGVFTVSGTHYYGATPAASYTIGVAIAGPSGESGTATSMAVVSNTSNVSVIPTTFAVNPDSPFVGTVATFIDPNPAATSSKPTATINWGNGTVSAGTVTGPDANGVFTVTGGIFYLTTSTDGTYPVTVTVTDASGQSGSAMSTAVMNTPAPSPSLTGGLDLGGENGPFAASGFANTNRPTFTGTTSPFALVQLYARRTDVDATLSLGQTVAGANGTFSLGVGPLSEGIFAITAIVTPAGGSPTGPLPLIAGNGGSPTAGPVPGGPTVGGNTGLFAIDTTPPQIAGVYSDGKGDVLVEFRDGLSGMELPSLGQAVNYTFQYANGSTTHPAKATVILVGGLPTDIQTVELTLGGKSKTIPKTLRITAAEILDNAGNPLAANYHGGIAPPRYLAKSNPVVKVSRPKPKPHKH